MSRVRLAPLTVSGLRALPAACPGCILGPVGVPGLDLSGRTATWARAAQADWGFCGIAAREAGVLIGYLLLAAPLHVPRTGPQSGGLNPDAAVVMTLRVLEPYAGFGVGRQLVQAATARLARTQFRALEVRGTNGTPACALPAVGFLEAVGFVRMEAHPLTPRLRLEFSRTVRWVPDLRPAWERIVGWARPLPPEPARLASVDRGVSAELAMRL